MNHLLVQTPQRGNVVEQLKQRARLNQIAELHQRHFPAICGGQRIMEDNLIERQAVSGIVNRLRKICGRVNRIEEAARPRRGIVATE